jgi:hypothetical protein
MPNAATAIITNPTMKSIFIQINSELMLAVIARRTFEIMFTFAGLAVVSKSFI